MKLPRTAAVTLLVAALGTGAMPAHAEQGIPWNSLSQDEQETLHKHRKDWPNKSRQEQTRLLRGARKYMELPADKRREVERKRDQYRSMPPEERERLREKYSRQKKDR